MDRVARYFRLWGAFARFSLTNEMAFRGNFIAKVLVEALLLCILLVFFTTPRSATPVASSRLGAGCVFILSGMLLHPGRHDRDAVLENALEFAG